MVFNSVDNRGVIYTWYWVNNMRDFVGIAKSILQIVDKICIVLNHYWKENRQFRVYKIEEQADILSLLYRVYIDTLV